jgi:hypothetical protein
VRNGARPEVERAPAERSTAEADRADYEVDGEPFPSGHHNCLHPLATDQLNEWAVEPDREPTTGSADGAAAPSSEDGQPGRCVEVVGHGRAGGQSGRIDVQVQIGQFLELGQFGGDEPGVDRASARQQVDLGGRVVLQRAGQARERRCG